MNYRRLAPLVTALSLALAFPVITFATSSGDHGDCAEKVEHFKVPVPETKDAAAKLLKDSLAKIEASLGKADFSAIHEATYSIESALAKISKEKGYDSVSETVTPRVEIVHLASELEDADTLKSAVPALLKAANGQLGALLK